MGKSAMSLSRGRYTLAEAVEVFLVHQTGFDREALTEDLRFLMERKRIIAYQPGLPKSINSISTNNSGEFYWEDLNKIWLSHFDNQKWHFSKPVEKLMPDWAYWRLMKHVELEAAIYLSLNINPHWSVFTENLDGDVLVQYRDRLAQVISWIADAEWVVGKVKSSWFIEHTKISLGSFAEWFSHEMGALKRPLEFDALASLSGAAKLLEDSSVNDSGESTKPFPQTLRPKEWHPLAEQYATEFLTADDTLSLTMVADRIRDQFIQNDINFVKGEIKVATINAHLSKGWGFSRQRNIIRNNKK
jgi:hypothetical protein